MAEISIDVEEEFDITTHTVVGSLTPEDIIRSVELRSQGVQTLHYIWDLTRAKLTDIPREEMRTTMRTTRRFVVPRKGGKIAFVVARKVDFGMGRMLETLMKTSEYPVEPRTFMSIDDARDWVDGENGGGSGEG